MFTVAIVGRPNVGKSTLFNRLTKDKKAIVHDLPGVSRDRNYGVVRWNNKSFILIDTGGFEPDPKEPLSSRIHEQISLAIEEAHVIIFLTDGKSGLLPGDIEIFKILKASEKKIFYVINKIDTEKDLANLSDFYQLGFEPLYPVSAKNGYGITVLMDDLLSNLPGEITIESDDNITKLAIVGRPNVGKSSLINRILGYNRLIVSEYPGTTRDPIDTLIRYFGESYLLIDTAGIRKKSNVSQTVEKYSIIGALKSIERCDIGILILDATEGVTDQDARIAGYLFEQGKGIIIAVNKWDLLKKDSNTLNKYTQEIRNNLPFLDFAPIIFVSALTGQRVRQILKLAQQVSHNYRKRLVTSKLNQILQSILNNQPPPLYHGHPVKLYYITQIKTAPPLFLVFCNYPEAINASYKRYLINQFRENFGLMGVPLRLIFRERK